jgi:hypothetical protein
MAPEIRKKEKIIRSNVLRLEAVRVSENKTYNI